MEITEEQRRRAEANRVAALEKRKRLEGAAPSYGEWKLVKCQSTSAPVDGIDACPAENQAEKPPTKCHRFAVVLEICSPDEFCVTPKSAPGFPFLGEAACIREINSSLSPVPPFCYVEFMGRRKSMIYKLKDYELVLHHLRKLQLQLHEIPYVTRAAIEKSSCYSSGDRWSADRASHCSENEIDELLKKLPKLLMEALLPFQLEGVRFGLQRGGCCLIADEMGLGKTIQAITIACCFMDKGPILIICPAILRFSWAEELEHWLPICLPTDIHLVFGHLDNIDRLPRIPKFVVISYTMLHRLRDSILRHKWGLVIVDESHNIRCTKKASESEETKAVIDVALNTERVVLLSGTPSLSRPYDIFHQINILWPYLLGKDKYEFAKNYCSLKFIKGPQGRVYKDFSSGIRLEELNILLKQTVMIRRLKEHVMTQLPPKRRQVIRLLLKKPDILSAKVSLGATNDVTREDDDCFELEGTHDTDNGGGCDDDHSYSSDDDEDDINDNGERCFKSPRSLSYQEIGIAKISGFCEWFSNHFMVDNGDTARYSDTDFSSQKIVIFAHHIKVLDGVQDLICGKGIQFVRIDGTTIPRDRKIAVETFRLSKEVKVAIIGITAGGVGLDFSAAQNIAFLELPRSASEMLQAEDRAHRRGQNNAVNIYIFCAKDTRDESLWLHLNKSLYRVSSMMNGKSDAVKEIEVDSVLDLACHGEDSCCINPESSFSDVELGIEDKGSNRTREKPVCSQSREADKSSSLAEEVNSHDEEMSSTSFEKIDDQDSTLTSSVSVESKATEERSADWSKSKDENGEFGDKGTVTKAVTGFSSPEDSLRFEVSRYTGRIHLYLCTSSKDVRPRPLYENYRPEEVDSESSHIHVSMDEVGGHALKQNPAYWEALKTFIKEWNNLRPVDQNNLLGKPLQLPLQLELCYLKESISHGRGGLLRGGSKRRVTPLTEINHGLPENAVWKRVALQRGPRRKKTTYLQAWMNDLPLCKLCQSPCRGKLSMKPEFFEDLFCDLSCFQEFRTRTSQGFLREALFQIEHGICTVCKLDCHRLVESIKPLSTQRRREYILQYAPQVASKRTIFEKLAGNPTEGNAWHADHIVPVYKGGGECKLENMRTLCVACHSDVTAVQRVERHLMRAQAKERLRIAMDELREKDVEQSNVGEVDEEEELFVKVPGSAYFTQDDSQVP